jgi:two-component system sensor histidine kinase YesM
MLKNSIKYKIVFSIIIIILPFLVLINYNNFYYLKLIRHEIAQASVSTTSLYISQIDKAISEIESYLFKLSSVNGNYGNEYVFDLDNSDELKRFYANYNLSRQIQDDITIYNLSSFLFVYTRSYDYIMYAYNTDTTYPERMEITGYIKENISDGQYEDNRNWKAVNAGRQYYLTRIVKRGDVYFGAFVSFNKIAEPLKYISNKNNGSFIFTDLNGQPLTNNQFIEDNVIDLKGDLNSYYLSGKPRQFIISGGESSVGDFKLLMAIPDRKILEGLNSIQYFILAISILAIFILPFLLWLIYLWVLKPMETLKKAISKIENGDLDYRIGDSKASREFTELFHAMNSMTSQIKTLKINVYEEIIEKQKIELRYLQTQIKPHFLMNALATITNFARMGNYQSMYEFIYNLSNYIRYMFRSNMELIPLKDEANHVNHYLSMQELRLSGYLSHFTDIDEAVENLLIPPFTIHTFVENAIKHAITYEKTVNVFIKAEPVKIGDMSYTRIVIEDDGIGMGDEDIERLNNEQNFRDDGMSIGIRNIKQTLRIIYSGKAGVKVSSSDLSGVMVEISIPGWKG